MSSTVRAKFRCMSVARRWDGQQVVDLRPVTQKRGDNAENKAFFASTPSGECELFYCGEAPFVPGAYYYIDATKAEGEALADAGLWSFDETTRRMHDSGGSVSLTWWRPRTDYSQPLAPGLVSGRFKAGLASAKTLALFGEPVRGAWRVAFTHAEDDDGTP